MVDGRDVWAAPPVGKDHERYQEWLRGITYRAAVLRRAERTRVTLSAPEIEQVKSSAPSKTVSATYLREHGISYEEFLHDRLEVALIQKLEWIEVAKRVPLAKAGIPKQGPRPEQLREAFIAWQGQVRKEANIRILDQ